MLRKIFSFGNMPTIVSAQARDAKLYKDLLRHEAKIGGKLFGHVPKGTHREFFCLDEHTWVWHEEWKENGQNKVRTTRYDVRPSGVVKSQNGGHYQQVSGKEALRLLEAAEAYEKRVNRELYQALA